MIATLVHGQVTRPLYFWVAPQRKASEAAKLAKAEEEGEEITTDLRPHVWRFRTLGLCLGGDSLEAAEHDIKNVISFDGERARIRGRCHECSHGGARGPPCGVGGFGPSPVAYGPVRRFHHTA